MKFNILFSMIFKVPCMYDVHRLIDTYFFQFYDN